MYSSFETIESHAITLSSQLFQVAIIRCANEKLLDM
jgi:hypothetical protein